MRYLKKIKKKTVKEIYLLTVYFKDFALICIENGFLAIRLTYARALKKFILRIYMFKLLCMYLNGYEESLNKSNKNSR